MSVSSSITFNGSSAVTPAEDVDKVQLRRHMTGDTPLTHDDMDDNFANLANKLNELITEHNTLESNAITSLGGLGLDAERVSVSTDNDLTSFTGATLGGFVLRNSDYQSGDFSALDFSYENFTKPIARIAAKITGVGSELHFGTSYNYATGITNTALSINKDGQVGVGLGNPGAKLDILGASLSEDMGLRVRTNPNGNTPNHKAASIGLAQSSNTHGTVLDVYHNALSTNCKDANLLQIRTNVTASPETEFIVKGDGKVGVGVGDPKTFLDVMGTDTANNVTAQFRNVDEGSYIGFADSASTLDDGRAKVILGAVGNNLVAGTDWSQRLRITSKGNVQATNQIRACGWHQTEPTDSSDADYPGPKGLGTEIGVSSGQGYVMAYDRDNGSYGTLNIQSSGSRLQLGEKTYFRCHAGTMQGSGNAESGSGLIWNHTGQGNNFTVQTGFVSGVTPSGCGHGGINIISQRTLTNRYQAHLRFGESTVESDGSYAGINLLWQLRMPIHGANDPSADSLRMYSYSADSGVGADVLTATAAKRVGIANANPGYTLDVAGDINFTGSLKQNGTDVTFGGSSLWTANGSDISYNAGKVGIGTTAPDAPLTLHNSTDPEIRFGYSAGQDHRITWDGSKVYIDADPDDSNASSAIGLNVDGTTRLYITDDGNVGIGTTEPNNSLHVRNPTDGYAGIRLSGSQKPDATTHYEDNDWTIYASRGSNGSDPHFLGFHNHDSNDGATTGYKFKITKEGKVGVGHAGGSWNPAHVLDVVGGIGSSDYVLIENDTAEMFFQNAAQDKYWALRNTGASPDFIIDHWVDGSSTQERMRFKADGDVIVKPASGKALKVDDKAVSTTEVKKDGAVANSINFAFSGGTLTITTT